MGKRTGRARLQSGRKQHTDNNGFSRRAASRTGSYNPLRNVFTILRIAFSSRRYQRHCPFLVASTNPAFVKMPM